MKLRSCPRCLEPFEHGERFCKQCGLRKSRPFSPIRWWSFALLLDLICILFVTFLREKMLAAQGLPLDLSSETLWPLLGVFSLFLLLPTIFAYQAYRVLWLRRYGVVGSGKVVEHVREMTKKGTRVIAIVKFTSDISQNQAYEVRHWAWLGVLPLHTKVQVLYDPYNPGSCTQVGSGLSDLVMWMLMFFLLAGLVGMIIWGVLTMVPIYL